MLIIPYVAAEFRDRNGSVIHRLTAEDRGTLHEAPDAIREDLLFSLLVADGSIKVAENEGQKKTLERDPMAGVSPDGKSAVLKEEKPARSGRPAKTEEKAAEPEKK